MLVSLLGAVFCCLLCSLDFVCLEGFPVCLFDGVLYLDGCWLRLLVCL